MTQKTELPHARAFQGSADGNVRAVHVIPSGDVAALFVFCAIAQNTEPFQATRFHASADGRLRAVHVIPSDDVLADEELLATAQKIDPFVATDAHCPVSLVVLGSVPVSQVIPSRVTSDVALAVNEPVPKIQNLFTRRQNTAGMICALAIFDQPNSALRLEIVVAKKPRRLILGVIILASSKLNI